MTPAVRASGKAFLAGEYAVLAGAPAVVLAVDRYAEARLGEGPPRSRFVAEAAARARAWLEARGIRPPEGTPCVDSSALALRRGPKLGLGSSAAATAAAAGVVLAAAGLDAEAAEVRRAVLVIACGAHRAVQGGGSGADVAAAVEGGVVRVVPAGDDIACTPVQLPAGLAVEFFWTGRSASTPALLATVAEAAHRSPGEHARAIDELARAAHAFAAAATPAEAIEAARAALAGLRTLGEIAGIPIVTGACERLAAIAERAGGTAKPSGAGGGDLAVALLPSAAAAVQVRAIARVHRLVPVRLAPGRGLHVVPPEHGTSGTGGRTSG